MFGKQIPRLRSLQEGVKQVVVPGLRILQSESTPCCYQISGSKLEIATIHFNCMLFYFHKQIVTVVIPPTTASQL